MEILDVLERRNISVVSFRVGTATGTCTLTWDRDEKVVGALLDWTGQAPP